MRIAGITEQDYSHGYVACAAFMGHYATSNCQVISCISAPDRGLPVCLTQGHGIRLLQWKKQTTIPEPLLPKPFSASGQAPQLDEPGELSESAAGQKRPIPYTPQSQDVASSVLRRRRGWDNG